mgnify:CR=1 FL=1
MRREDHQEADGCAATERDEPIQLAPAHGETLPLTRASTAGSKIQLVQREVDILKQAGTSRHIRAGRSWRAHSPAAAAQVYTPPAPESGPPYPAGAELLRRIGVRQIRKLGTIGGNIGNASPIGDTPPCLIALDATLTLASAGGEREIAIEDFFLDYRETDLKPGEVIKTIRIPKLTDGQSFRTYKVSKRYDQDISAVIGGFRITLAGDRVTEARIAYGGMAATPKRARAAEAALTGTLWSEDAAVAAGAGIAEDYAPLTDHRATADYRSRVAANLCTRLYRDLAGTETDLDRKSVV